MKKIMFLVFMTSLFFLTSCGNKMACFIDNPTDKEMKVSLDGKEIALAPKEFKKIDDISKGEHKMIVDGGQEQTFSIDSVFTCMINPTGSDYVVWEEEYAVGAGGPDHLDMVPVVIGGDNYTGPFEVRSGNPIKYKDIHYSVLEELPEEAEILGDANFTIKRKLYRMDDFKADPASEDYKDE